MEQSFVAKNGMEVIVEEESVLGITDDEMEDYEVESEEIKKSLQQEVQE